MAKSNSPFSAFKPTKKNNGAALSFNSRRDDKGKCSLFGFLVRQNSQTGNFKDNSKFDSSQNVRFKCSKAEMGGLIHAVEDKVGYSAYHQSNNGGNTLQISFNPYIDKEDNQVKGFWLNVIRNGNDTFKIPLNIGEAIELREFLIAALHKEFDQAIDESNNAYYQARQNSQRSQSQTQSQTQAQAQVPQPPSSATEPSEDEENPFTVSGSDNEGSYENPF